jgi:hypothetical protein
MQCINPSREIVSTTRRRRHGVPHRHILDFDLPLAIAADDIPYDPLFTSWVTAMHRTTGRVIGSGQRLRTEEAQQLFTIERVRLTFDESWKGRPEGRARRGSYHPVKEPCSRLLDEIRSLEYLMTIVDGTTYIPKINQAVSTMRFPVEMAFPPTSLERCSHIRRYGILSTSSGELLQRPPWHSNCMH